MSFFFETTHKIPKVNNKNSVKENNQGNASQATKNNSEKTMVCDVNDDVSECPSTPPRNDMVREREMIMQANVTTTYIRFVFSSITQKQQLGVREWNSIGQNLVERLLNRINTKSFLCFTKSESGSNWNWLPLKLAAAVPICNDFGCPQEKKF